MNINTKNHKTKLTISLIVALMVVIGIGGAVFTRVNTPAVAEVKAYAPEAKSKFSFTGSTDWRKGPSNDTSMALFGKTRTDGTSACFTSIEYKTGTIDVQAELQKVISDFNKSGGTMTEMATVPAVLRTTNGDEQYNLHQFNAVSASKDNKVMSGVEVGYVQLDGGYVKVSGNCETFDELPSTIPALQAYKFN
jgi:hypothetical protein